jgi:protein-tyrosine phosphatase
VIHWTVAGGCDRLEVGWGITPDGGEHHPVRSVAAAEGSLVLDKLPQGRIYVTVAPACGGAAVIAAERNVGLRGAQNFRDLGGYRTVGDARVRWGLVFRSDALILEDSDLDLFSGLGVRTVYDLRSDPERELIPNRLPGSDYTLELVSLVSDSDARGAFNATLADGESFLADLYLDMLDRAAISLGRILTGLADATRLPAVFHCAAGKDRTGMVAALLLSVLGVADEDILDDYELSSRYRNSERLMGVMERLRAERGVTPEVAAGIAGTPRWAMRATLSELRRRYGGIEGYLAGPAAVDPTVVDSLRRLLLI